MSAVTAWPDGPGQAVAVFVIGPPLADEPPPGPGWGPVWFAVAAGPAANEIAAVPGSAYQCLGGMVSSINAYTEGDTVVINGPGTDGRLWANSRTSGGPAAPRFTGWYRTEATVAE